MHPAALLLGVGALGGLGWAVAKKRPKILPNNGGGGALPAPKDDDEPSDDEDDDEADGPTPSGGETPADEPMQSINVKAAQTNLLRIGHALTIDGKFGPLTQKAWAAFANAHKLPPVATGATGATSARVAVRTAKALAAAATKAPPLDDADKAAAADRAKALEAAKEAKAREESAQGGGGMVTAPITSMPAENPTITVSTKTVQTILRDLGAPDVVADGKYGPITAKRWLAAAQHVKLNGSMKQGKTLAQVQVYQNTFKRLESEAQKRKAGTTPAPSGGAPVRTAPITSMPAENPSIVVSTKTVQTILRKLGASDVATDGKYGPITAKRWATEASERKLNGGSKQGKTLLQMSVYQNTFKRLEAEAASASAPPPTAASRPPATQPAQPTRPPAQPPADAETIAITTLRAQQLLNRHGAGVATDGVWGPLTRGAWEKLATSHHVSSRFEKASPDGRQTRVDTQTLRKLEGLPPSSAASTPVGYDRTKAKARAKEVSAKLRQQGKAYDRKYLAGWQTQAGLTPDGLYGPLTRNALIHYGADAPPAYVKGTDRPYTPPG